MNRNKGAIPKETGTKPTIPKTGSKGAGKGAVPKTTKEQPFQRSQKTVRTPPQASNQNVSIYLCQICLAEDDLEKVRCDKCLLWYHFTCAKLTSEVVNQDVWICSQCNRAPSASEARVDRGQLVTVEDLVENKEENPSGYSKVPPIGLSTSKSNRSHKTNSITSTVSRKTALALQRLEEERQMLELRENEALRRQRDRDQEYLNQKYSILEDDRLSNLSFDDQELEVQKRESVRQWTESLPDNNDPLKFKVTDEITNTREFPLSMPQLNSTILAQQSAVETVMTTSSQVGSTGTKKLVQNGEGLTSNNNQPVMMSESNRQPNNIEIAGNYVQVSSVDRIPVIQRNMELPDWLTQPSKSAQNIRFSSFSQASRNPQNLELPDWLTQPSKSAQNIRVSSVSQTSTNPQNVKLPDWMMKPPRSNQSYNFPWSTDIQDKQSIAQGQAVSSQNDMNTPSTLMPTSNATTVITSAELNQGLSTGVTTSNDFSHIKSINNHLDMVYQPMAMTNSGSTSSMVSSNHNPIGLSKTTSGMTSNPTLNYQSFGTPYESSSQLRSVSSSYPMTGSSHPTFGNNGNTTTSYDATGVNYQRSVQPVMSSHEAMSSLKHQQPGMNYQTMGCTYATTNTIGVSTNQVYGSSGPMNSQQFLGQLGQSEPAHSQAVAVISQSFQTNSNNETNMSPLVTMGNRYGFNDQLIGSTTDQYYGSSSYNTLVTTTSSLAHYQRIPQTQTIQSFSTDQGHSFGMNQSIAQPINANGPTFSSQFQPPLNNTTGPVFNHHHQQPLLNMGSPASGTQHQQPLNNMSGSLAFGSQQQPPLVSMNGPSFNQQQPSSTVGQGYNNQRMMNQSVAANSYIPSRLTAEQIASRHVMPKDLPHFYGDPIEWQGFISAYENSTGTCGYSNSENLGRLQKCLKGDAEKAVKSRLIHPDSVPGVIDTLRLLYGRPEFIIETMIQNIQKTPPPNDDDLASLIKFAISIRNLSDTIQNTGSSEHLRNPMLINSITDKLPAQFQLNWAFHKQMIGNANVGHLGDWLYKIAEVASQVVRVPSKSRKPEQRDNNKSNPSKPNNSKPNNYLNTQVENTSKKNIPKAETKRDCPACKSNSCVKLANCKKFKELQRNERWIIVKDNKLCGRCFGNHKFYRCQSNQSCTVEGCKSNHHTLLHNYETSSEATSNTGQKQSDVKSKDVPDPTKKSCNSHRSRNQRSDKFRIVPVMLHYKDKSLRDYAYLDEGSNMTTMEDSLANDLNLSGTPEELCVDWALGETHSTDNSRVVSVGISGDYINAPRFKMSNVRTVKHLNLPTQSVTTSWIDKYSHLKNIPIATYESVKPRLLIGLQYSKYIVSLQTIEGDENEPIACRTRLGWVVQGPTYEDDNSSIRQKFRMNMCDCQSNDNKLHQMVKDYFSLENFGVKIPENNLESTELQRANKILESTTIKKGDRYESGLLWKFDNVELPDSYNMALKRLVCLETKMAKNPELKTNLSNQIKQFVEKGYIRKLSPEEVQNCVDQVWYLPTFPVFNPKKPEKVRLVWDGAAKVKNTSLNSNLLAGPDQLVPLPELLRRFRERAIAVTGDIAEMYHQIKVPERDQNVQRFLWRDDPSKECDVYVMTVMTFGSKCSPSVAQYVKNKNANEFKDKFPRAVESIIENHYVDDMIDCTHTVDEAYSLVQNVKQIHQAGGFHIRKFTSNSRELLEKIGEEVDTQHKNLNISTLLGTERVLGMFWDTDNDFFTYSLKFTALNEKMMSGEYCPTKREVLRILMSVFDPLGLLANFLVYAKILLQEIWRSQTDWDEKLPDSIHAKWVKWLKELPSVEKLQIPRLYSPKLSPRIPNSIQLHTFVDAGIEACAAVSYLRILDDEGVDCCLVGAKTKVAPNKPMSVPRLELQAAVLGTRLAEHIKTSQTLKFEKQVYWSDSQTVMGWINSEARRYNQFVSFRIGEILEATEPKEWRWVPSKQNVADEATKSKEVAKLESNSRWFKAPRFLYDDERSWFNEDIDFSTEEELKPCFVMACREIQREQLIQLERFSQWNKLIRVQAIVLRVVYNWKNAKQNRRSGPLSREEWIQSVNCLYQRAQRDAFLDEILILKHNEKVPLEQQKEFEKSSELRTFSPYLDEQNVVRMRSRTDLRPIILPRRHRITKLIVDHYHRRYRHINHATALNEINQRYVIPALRVVMKGIRASCQECKNKLAAPKIPEMAELPPARLATYTLPFTYVGVDYFGPLKVRNGRKTRSRPTVTEKRWVLLFTCLTTRAIYMEISDSLDTNACIQSVENFCMRRGYPREIYSDNGSSFHGADNELQKEFEKLDKTEIEEKFTNTEMKWKFNPPGTPHMGGVWERLIQTVKKCLKETVKTRTPNDQMLKNLIIHAENIVNSRPLTYVSLETAEEEALTPNHILLGSSNGSKPLGRFTDKDMVRNTYKAVQVLANNFWRRFVLEYMPTLTKRTKWFKQVEPIKAGDIVLIIDENNERNTWPKGIVEELLPGKGGIVRQVMVRTVKGMRRRSVAKLAVLDVKPPTKDEVKQDLTEPVNEGEYVGQRCMSGNTESSCLMSNEE